MKKFPHLPAVVLAGAVLGIVLGQSWRVHELETKNDVLESQLREGLVGACSPVHVTCECPDYEEGWDDAQHAEGCDPGVSDMSFEDLALVCDQLEEYGYVPSC